MQVATRTAFGEALVELGVRYDDIVVLDADLSGSTKTASFGKKFPDRFFNVGIAEQDLIGTAGGLAIAGKNVFAASFAMFLIGRAYDQIRNTIVYSKLNVKLVGSHAGILTGEDGATHQMLEDISLMRGLEGMIVLQPADAEETRQMVAFLSTYNGPAYLRLGRADVNVIYSSSNYSFALGKADTLMSGNDICVMATGALVQESISAATKLKQDKISVEVINMSSLMPIDRDAIEDAAKRFKTIVTIEDHSITGGLGSVVAEVMAETPTGARLKRLGMNGFGESGTPEDLYLKYGFDSDSLVKTLKDEYNKSQCSNI